MKLRTKFVKRRLLTNVCRYRGYVLNGYPRNYEEAEDLFTELQKEEGDEEAPAEEEEEEEADPEEGEEAEEEEEEEKPPAEEEDEDEEENKPKRVLNTSVAPEFVVALQSSQERCKERLFAGLVEGPSTEDDFLRQFSDYKKACLTEDGSAGTSDFFADIAGCRVLNIDVDRNSETESFQAIRVYIESRGQFFNYLKSEEELAREQAVKLEANEQTEDERLEAEKQAKRDLEEASREKRMDEEAGRRKRISEGEAALLESEAMPLRQYLMLNVVPTLTDGLTEVCKNMPDEPIEYLAQYLFAHAQDIGPQLNNR